MIGQIQASARPRSEGTLFDRLRANEYARLDREGHVYLDFTGGGVYAESQIRQHAELLDGHVLGNPHSFNPSSLAATELVDKARRQVLEFFNASPDEYTVIFTHNATIALKLVGEAYPFEEGRLLMTYDNHNSVNGIREFARRSGAAFQYVPIAAPELRVDETLLRKALGRARRGGHNLFAYPAQSNFSGVQHPLEYIPLAQEQGWDVVADCAAFTPTNRLDLSKWHPDFVPLSFYKMFGYPTGVGCLLARQQALAKLKRPWFAGGTVWGVSVAEDFHVLLEGGAGFEDGTVDYLNIPAIEIGLRYLASIGIDNIHDHVTGLMQSLFDQLLVLHHSNGKPLVEVYGPRDCRMRGATVSLNLLEPSGQPVDERIIERTSIERRISVRTGCFCNPGGFEGAWKITRDKYKAFKPKGWHLIKVMLGMEKWAVPTMQDYVDKLRIPNGGAVRLSLGISTNQADITAFVAYAKSFLDTVPDCSNLRPRLGC